MLKWPSLIKQTSFYTAENEVFSIHYISPCELSEVVDCITKLSFITVAHKTHLRWQGKWQGDAIKNWKYECKNAYVK